MEYAEVESLEDDEADPEDDEDDEPDVGLIPLESVQLISRSAVAAGAGQGDAEGLGDQRRREDLQLLPAEDSNAVSVSRKSDLLDLLGHTTELMLKHPQRSAPCIRIHRIALAEVRL